MEILLVFKTRNQTLRCANFLRAAGYAAAIADTPLRIYGSCTLSVRCDRDGFAYFRGYAATFPSFAGAYANDDGKYVRIF